MLFFACVLVFERLDSKIELEGSSKECGAFQDNKKRKREGRIKQLGEGRGISGRLWDRSSEQVVGDIAVIEKHTRNT